MYTDPAIWGPHYWFMLHNSAAHYPDNPTIEDKIHAKGFLVSLYIMIPCQECSEHTQDYISTANIDRAVQSRDSLFSFFVNFHNNVNKRLGKPTMSLGVAKKKYY